MKQELIWELMKQAGVKYVTMPKDTVYEKFAELIVRECVEHLESSVLVPNIEHSRTKTKCVRAIKEHFGVEE
jgi:hypothetical protein